VAQRDGGVVVDLAAYRREREAASPTLVPMDRTALLTEGMLLLGDMTEHELALAVGKLRRIAASAETSIVPTT
jgi:hypothetical protein